MEKYIMACFFLFSGKHYMEFIIGQKRGYPAPAGQILLPFFPLFRLLRLESQLAQSIDCEQHHFVRPPEAEEAQIGGCIRRVQQLLKVVS
jgi:hypothetical protein